MINEVKNIKKRYIILFLIFTFVLITPFTYSKYTSKYTKHIVISAIQSGYKVKFDSNGGEGTMEMQSFEYGTAQKLNKSLFTKEDYVFSNWNTAADGSGTSYKDEEEVKNLTNENGKTIVLYAIYSRVKFVYTGDIVFDGQNGENPYIDTGVYLFNEGNIRKDFEVSFEIKSRDTTDYLATMMSVMDESGDPYPGMVYRVFSETTDQLVINTVSVDTLNEKYYPPDIHKVTLKRINDSIYLSFNDSEDVELFDASSMQNPFNVPVVFGASYDSNMQPQRWFKGTLSNLKVIVKEPNTEIGIIKFNPNGGEGNLLSQNVLPNTTYTLMKNRYTREDYVFNGWNTAADGSGTSYVDEQEVTNLVNSGEKLYLYAQWKKYKYTVQYDANGGTGSMDSQEFNSGIATNLKPSTFTKDGYSFAFWNTKADGSGASYEDQDSVINLATEDNQVITLYAMYEQFNYHIDGDIIFDETNRFDGKNYIDTHIYLFSRKNVNKNFEISFEIKNYNNIKDFHTIVSSLDESGTPYPGFVFRINKISDEYKYELEVNSSSSREVVNHYSLDTTKKVVIKRVDGILYLKLGDEAEQQIIDYSTLANTFYYPLTVGASLDVNFVEWRHFNGTISNLNITLDTTEPTEVQ